ncbi:hypothetical protein F4775DRAFT_465618 [Biscogniauxia sp. FL1348]|nr:hypothetical protein F4775DRAFT_465618 [Biscogniauxia sp. FL1348]
MCAYNYLIRKCVPFFSFLTSIISLFYIITSCSLVCSSNSSSEGCTPTHPHEAKRLRELFKRIASANYDMPPGERRCRPFETRLGLPMSNQSGSSFFFLALLCFLTGDESRQGRVDLRPEGHLIDQRGLRFVPFSPFDADHMQTGYEIGRCLASRSSFFFGFCLLSSFTILPTWMYKARVYIGRYLGTTD